MTNMKMTNQESGFGALVDNLWGKLTGHVGRSDRHKGDAEPRLQKL